MILLSTEYELDLMNINRFYHLLLIYHLNARPKEKTLMSLSNITVTRPGKGITWELELACKWERLKLVKVSILLGTEKRLGHGILYNFIYCTIITP